MKKIFLGLAFIAFSFTSEAQIMSFSENSQIAFRKSPDFKDANTAGSKYFSEEFSNAKVNKGSELFLIRYNAYSDLMEYKNGKDLLDLIKEKNVHFIFQDGSIYELMNYSLDGKDYSRYHQILFEKGDMKVSKFKSIKLIPSKKAANSYEKDTQATYKENKDVYFVTYNNQTIEFDGKSKTLEKLIPGKAAEIKQFFKENKIKENDNDMIKVGNFLATL